MCFHFFSHSDAAYSKLDGKLEKEQEHSDDFAIEMSTLSKPTMVRRKRWEDGKHWGVLRTLPNFGYICC
jgi:hypothetical protein